MSDEAAILHLNLHREFFAQIAAGTKWIEYRDRSPHWKSRLEGRRYDMVQPQRVNVVEPCILW